MEHNWPTEEHRLKSKREAARYLGVCIGSVERFVRSGELPYIRIGSLVKFRSEDLAEYVERRRVRHTGQPGDDALRPTPEN